MPQNNTCEKNLNEIDNSLLDFVKDGGQVPLQNTEPVNLQFNPAIKINGIFKEVDCDLEIMMPKGRKKRAVGKS